MDLAAVVVIANKVGCVYEPRGSAARTRGAAAAASGAAIAVALQQQQSLVPTQQP